MAKALNVSQQVVSYQLKHTIKKKCHKKPKCHHLNERSVQIRRQRSWPLQKLLRKDRWRKFITTDEAWIYLFDTSAKSKVQYLNRDQNRRDLTPSTTVPHPKVDDYCRLYPNGDAVFHEDSTPSHASWVTQKFLTDQQVQFLRPQQWMPNSPDGSSCDYFLWGHLRNKLNKRGVSTLRVFKKLLEKR
ncbi:hypothetical protein AVEN_239511-1 [Araneus ventricosus]|uniref:Transposase Tc1-like domain-containing protein n=1 Tax=Araneus ventricosus TaxID=182803 RepID=A0A4Y2VBK1_ARAVE|nr:hypothetical protein AVEN_239511-1 [Araneus ventricosus]